MSTTTLHLDQFVDPFEAKVVYSRDAAGAITDARFDLSGLPRLDPVLLGKPVASVPDVVKRLCGICPVTHHLAGMRALDMLYGASVPKTARLVRRLLNAGSILDAAAPKLFATDRELAVLMKKVGKQAMAAAGSPGHFPDVAVPGGVRAPGDPALVTDIAELVDALRRHPATEEPWKDEFSGLSVALTTGDELDSLGDVVSVGGGQRLTAEEFAARVVESKPGEAAPRPVLDGQFYRVGPLAQATVSNLTMGPQQAVHWMLQRVAQEVAEIVANPALTQGEIVGEGQVRSGTGIGLVEGPRGLLMHRYVADEEGRLVQCQILTPTAQNEPWLGEMLRASLRENQQVEGAIRAADPCLPITSAPRGAMNVAIEEES